MNDEDLSKFYKAFDEPDIVIEIAGHRIGFTAQFKTYDIKYIKEQADDNQPDDYRTQIIHIMYFHRTNDEVTMDEIQNVSDEDIERYITKYIASDDVLRRNYSSLEGDDYKRFIDAIKRTDRYYTKDSAILCQRSLADQYLRSAAVISQATQSISDMLKSYYSSWQSAMTPLLSRLSDVHRILNAGIDYEQVFQGLSNAISNLVITQPLADLYDERVQRLMASYREWGTYGWTIPPSAINKIFNKPPLDAKDANSQMAIYIHKDHMYELFNELRGLKHIRKCDLEEAIDDYNHGRYKSCAMLIFSMLDGRMIRLQDRTQYRSVGKSAVDKVLKRIKEDDLVGEMLFTVLMGANIFAAMSKVFAKGENFKKQPEIINRNFLDHGMMQGRVRRRDCAQLFLLLYNFTQFTNQYSYLIGEC